MFNDTLFFEKKNSLVDIIQQEKLQFNLFQYLNYKEYKQNRLTFLDKQLNSDLNKEFLNQFSPKIGLFPGSFNPFHKGHYNVLQKAEQIFDKVIIAFGKNPDKKNKNFNVPSTIKNRQVEYFDELLTDLIKSLNQDLVIIRGLRNTKDFLYEQKQYRYNQDLMPNIKVINVFCDKEFEHISSSGIRTLEKYNKHQNYLLD
jgi:pantetheine-phosphate adenylyltransferase